MDFLIDLILQVVIQFLFEIVLEGVARGLGRTSTRWVDFVVLNLAIGAGILAGYSTR